MDSLALLCTLHADGPATLGQLRLAGCQSLSDLQRIDAETLAGILQVPAAMARRLHREARLLQERFGADALDPEEAPDGMIVAMPDPTPVAVTQSSSLNHIDRGLIESVMGRASGSHGFRVHEDDELPDEEDGGEDFEPGFGSVPPRGLVTEGIAPGAMLVGMIDGLDRVVSLALAGAGVETLRGLVEADPNALARATGINFSRIRRLQFLARREESAPRLPATPPPSPEPLAPRREIVIPLVPTTPVPMIVGAKVPASESEVPELVEDPSGMFEVSAGRVAERPRPLPVSKPEPTLDLTDHPVFEFEPQSGGPMVVEPIERKEVTPLGRWLPREKREPENLPADCELPQPVLVPPPPPRRFWEPKRFWEARKNRREKAARPSTGETENMPVEGSAEQTVWQAKEAAPAPIEPKRNPTGALGWDFSTPAVERESSATRGFTYPEPQSAREDAAGPFA